MATAAKLPAAARNAARRRRPVSSAQLGFYFPQPIDNSRLVKYADPRERRAQTRLVLLAMLAVAAMLLAFYPRLAITRDGYQIEELKKQREQLLETSRKLRLEEATLRDPHRIDQIARSQLGMAPAAPAQMVNLGSLPSEGAPVLARVQPPPGSHNVKEGLAAPAP